LAAHNIYNFIYHHTTIEINTCKSKKQQAKPTIIYSYENFEGQGIHKL